MRAQYGRPCSHSFRPMSPPGAVLSRHMVRVEGEVLSKRQHGKTLFLDVSPAEQRSGGIAQLVYNYKWAASQKEVATFVERVQVGDKVCEKLGLSSCCICIFSRLITPLFRGIARRVHFCGKRAAWCMLTPHDAICDAARFRSALKDTLVGPEKEPERTKAFQYSLSRLPSKQLNYLLTVWSP